MLWQKPSQKVHISEKERLGAGNFAVIDIETTWQDRVMSIGAVVADGRTMKPIAIKYYIIDPEYREGGYFSFALVLQREDEKAICSRDEAITDLLACFRKNGAERLFAYNARFDFQHLSELGAFQWYDIMTLAAYRGYNPSIPPDAPLCSTGRLKRGYGVEPILQLLSGDRNYRETHNAWRDAMDELRIMELLGHPLDMYGRINR